MAHELILIVDDNEQNRRLARDVLQFAGFRTLEAAGGAEGLSLAAEHHPDLVLMDIRMPDMKGTEAVRRLREDERIAAIPVIALTSSTMKGDRERFLAVVAVLGLVALGQSNSRGKQLRRLQEEGVYEQLLLTDATQLKTTIDYRLRPGLTAPGARAPLPDSFFAALGNLIDGEWNRLC